jgi:hypothetical protein
MICSAVSHAREPKTSTQRLRVMRLQTVRILSRPGYSSRTIGRYLHNALAQVLFRAFRKRPMASLRHHPITVRPHLTTFSQTTCDRPKHLAIWGYRARDKAAGVGIQRSWLSP